MRKYLLLPVLAFAACDYAAVESADTETTQVSLQQRSEQASQISAPLAIEHEYLARLLQISPDIYSGAQPKTDDAFRSLKELGIKTIVSVDAARPNEEAALAEGMRYIHIPIGYDAIPEAASLAYAQLMREVELPVFIHCHHGRQRGPAASAIALRASTGCSSEAALAVLHAAGTSKKYEGLWRDVEAWTPSALDAEPVVLSALHELPAFTVKMAGIDRTWDTIKQLREEDWESVSLVPQTQLLLQQLQDCAGLNPAEHIEDQELHRGLDDVVSFAERMQVAAEALDKDLLEESYRDLRASCNDCHADYRNH